MARRALLAGRASGGFPGLELHQYLAHAGGQERAVSELSGDLEQRAGGQAAYQHRHGHRRHEQEERDEIPLRHRGDQQVLGFSHQRADTTQCGTHGAVHEQAAQECPEPVEVVPMHFVHRFVLGVIVIVMLQPLARGDLVVNSVKTHADADQYGGGR